TIVDRKEAIRTACLMAKKGDIVLVAGKGHENYQEIKGVKHHFDDKEVVSEIFNTL
ncbi:MAG TPA: UDP-N-acetylmuramoyl-L-alanyl-D-glutamate--2,6-diaminopimelate ligase, partial [Tenuifilaceae bacterium]|nr:UDP-N-acetylmuramoyl-L-alanyl-D-glutamate--2,6-diaminopimelate ligase [Tenuifilaceae bacterium]